MTRALILAAGQGTRLRPLTDTVPKCLVHLHGKSLLDRQVETLKHCGVQDIHIAAGYKAEQIQELGFDVSINPHFASTNMVESLFSARNFIAEGGDLIIAYGDIIYQQENLDTLLTTKSDVVLMIDKAWRDLWSARMEDPLQDAETLIINEHGYVTELGKKPKNYDSIQGQYTGLIKIDAAKIDDFIAFYDQLDRQETYDGKDFLNMYMTSFIQLVIDAGWQVKAAEVQNGWLEVDSVEDLRLYETLSENGNLDKLHKLNT
ncbi:MAG: choline kinase [Flavobacteriales bacterium]|jgi:choline kinase